jgi:magnesium transporter
VIYLSQMLGKPVVDAAGDEIGTINDIAIATGEVFPRVTSLAFKGPEKTPFMLSWRKYVAGFDGERVVLNAAQPELRFSYLQPEEVLLCRDLLNKQIVDTQGMKVVRVNDLKLSESRNQLRLLGAEVGARGILRGISPDLERFVAGAARALRTELPENIIAWNYMDLLDRDLSQVKLSVTHKRLHELHPADVADILEKLAPSQRAKVFEHLDNEQAAETISELEDDLQADVIDDLSEPRASALLAEMDPDDAADIIGDLPYDKAEALLRLMGVKESSVIRSLLGYKEKTAGGIMTPEVTMVSDELTVQEVIDRLRKEADEHETIYYVYVVEAKNRLAGVVSLRDLLLASPTTTISEIAERDMFVAHVDDDQEDVAEQMSKYDLLALPVVDETGKLLGIVTVDDALDVLEEESAEDLALATGSSRELGPIAGLWAWTLRRGIWVLVWGVAVVSAATAFNHARGVIAQTGGYGRGNALFGVAFLVPAAILLPLLLRTAEDASSRAVSEIIAGDSEKVPGLGLRLARELAVGIVVATGAALFGFVLLRFPMFGLPVEPFPAVFAAVCAAGVLTTVVIGGLLGEVARRRAEADKPISVTALSVASMLLSTAVFFALAAGAAILTLSMVTVR